MEGDHLCLCSESLDSALENNDLHIIVSAFYFARLNGSIFFMRLEQKKKPSLCLFLVKGHRLLCGIGACYNTHSASFEKSTASLSLH
jgi:hypothetical protein